MAAVPTLLCRPRLRRRAGDPELPPGAVWTHILEASSPGLRGQEGCIPGGVTRPHWFLALQHLQELRQGHWVAFPRPPPSSSLNLTLRARPLGEEPLKLVLCPKQFSVKVASSHQHPAQQALSGNAPKTPEATSKEDTA